jgi:alpha-ketoglutarate-dependent 2,4-dichlorophenoxyacetate dioxygenase
MSFSLKPLHPVFAAEVRGLPVSADVSPGAVEFLEDAMATYAVVVLPEQYVGDDEQIAFSRFFGPRETPQAPTAKNDGLRLAKYLFDASNLGTDHEILPADHPRRKMRGGDRLWHSDSSFNPLPTKWSMLHGRIIPPAGGNTDFCDTRAAYDSLPQKMKGRIEGMVAVHSLWHSRKKGGLEEVSEKQMQNMPPVYQPVVRTIPRSGRKALYVGAHARSIIGMPEEEGAKLLQELTDHCTQPQYVYSHPWREGDLVIWDNRCTLHRATPFEDLKYKRDMRRTTVDEYAPAWAAVG